MAIIQISKIQQRSGNIVDLPQLDEAEFGWATDVKRLYIGKTTPNENIEVLTSYSNISFSQINGSFGNLNIDGANIANGQVLTYTGSEWTNRGGNLGGLINLGDVSNVKIGGGATSYVLETDGTGNLNWAPKSTIIAYIENATQDNPGVITTVEDNYFVNGSLLTITNVPGMTELNGNSYYAKILTSNTFELYSDSLLTTPVDTSGYTEFPYTSATDVYTGTNKITIGDTSLFNVNDSVVFVGDLGNTGLELNTLYYVTDIPDSGAPGNITVSLTEGGSNVSFTDDESITANLYVPGGRAVSLVSSVGGGNGVAGGSNTMVQFNNTNTLDGSSDFTFNFGTTPKILTLNGNANVGNLNATSSVTASRLISNIATGSEPITVTSTTRVANLNVTSANIADFAGNVTIATQGNITSLGTLTTLNVSARVNATGFTSNVATGTAPLTVTSTTRVANLNVNYANVSDFGVVTVQTTGTFFPTFVSSSATGNRALGANANLSFNAATGNLATNILFANGNISGSNLSASANITATGNIISNAGNIAGVNLVASNSIFASRFIQTPYALVAPTKILNNGTGALSTITTAAAAGSNPLGIVVDPTGRFVYAVNGMSNNISQYSINQSTGALSSITTAIAAGVTPNSITVDPTGRFVYVTNRDGNTVSQYSINQSTGALSSITTAIATGAGPFGIVVDPTGRFVYVSNFDANTVSQYSINQSTGALSIITTAIAAGSQAREIAVDPTGRFVYVTNNGAGTISQYSINQSTGALISITTAIAAETLPIGISVDPTGRFVYVSNFGSSTVSQYSINQSTGALSSITTAIASGIGPIGITVDPTGKFVYVVNNSAGTVSQYSINQSTGALSGITTAIASGTNAWGIASDPTGRFVYVTNGGLSSVSQYSINNFSTGSAVIAGNLTVANTISGIIRTLTTGANTTTGTVTGNWTLTAGSRWNATYADLAEYYTSDQHYEPGTVLEFGGVYEVTLASNNTTSVAGVVSTDPAFAMNAKCAGEHSVAIALQGRVPTKVTGTVRKGDMMVSAGNGYATACSSPTLGTVIGKSLENFSGTGVIEIAVGRL